MRRTRAESVPREVTYETVCDGCGKIEAGEPENWVHFGSSHLDWGNDSIESMDDHDACSWRCFVGVVREIVADYQAMPDREPTLEVDGWRLPFLREMLADNLDREGEGDGQ